MTTAAAEGGSGGGQVIRRQSPVFSRQKKIECVHAVSLAEYAAEMQNVCFDFLALGDEIIGKSSNAFGIERGERLCHLYTTTGSTSTTK